MFITLQTVVWINKKFATGTIINDSLDFAIKIEDHKIFENLPHVIRALLTDHSFEDGNKRTAAYLIVKYCEEQKLEFNKERIFKTIQALAHRHYSDIEKIRRKIKYALKN